MSCWKESSAVLGPAALEISSTTKPRICKLFRLSYTKPLKKEEEEKKKHIFTIHVHWMYQSGKKDLDLRLPSIHQVFNIHVCREINCNYESWSFVILYLTLTMKSYYCREKQVLRIELKSWLFSRSSMSCISCHVMTGVFQNNSM